MHVLVCASPTSPTLQGTSPPFFSVLLSSFYLFKRERRGREKNRGGESTGEEERRGCQWASEKEWRGVERRECEKRLEEMNREEEMIGEKRVVCVCVCVPMRTGTQLHSFLSLPPPPFENRGFCDFESFRNEGED